MGVDTIFELAKPEGTASGIAAFTLKLVVVVMVWPYAPRPKASASASRPHFSTVVIVAQPQAAGDCAFVAVVVFILFPCWYRVRFVLLECIYGFMAEQFGSRVDLPVEWDR